MNVHNKYQTVEPEIPLPTHEEVKKTLTLLKYHKARGADGIQAELLRKDEERLLREVHYLISEIWQKKEIPTES